MDDVLVPPDLTRPLEQLRVGVRLFAREGKLYVRDDSGAEMAIDRAVVLAPRMLGLLRDAGQWYCGEMEDGTDRRAAIAALLKEIDGG